MASTVCESLVLLITTRSSTRKKAFADYHPPHHRIYPDGAKLSAGTVVAGRRDEEIACDDVPT
jgi:hypothetical protein